MDTNVLRRKLAGKGNDAAVSGGGPGADRGWRLSLARAARDGMGLALDVSRQSISRHSLAELIELLADQSLIVILDEDQGDGLGLLVMAPPVLAGLTEMLTMGRITPAPSPARKPTRTDAAMVSDLIDAALTGLEAVLAGEADHTWAKGYRYASFLDDPRPLSLLLDELPYRVIRAEVQLAGGAKSGEVLLALPDERRAARQQSALPQPQDAARVAAFAQDLSAQVDAVECRLDAVLARIKLPLARIMALTAGEVLPLPTAALDRICLEGIDTVALAEGKLGQHRGMRAVRLSTQAASSANVVSMLRETPAESADFPDFMATGTD
jgi:flagellar motor switch protein FliM